MTIEPRQRQFVIHEFVGSANPEDDNCGWCGAPHDASIHQPTDPRAPVAR